MKELIFGLMGGTALLMYGVDKMGDGLEKASGNLIRKMISFFTNNVFSAFFSGVFLTALVQSSTAVTVLTVGFVNAGLMKLPQAIGIIYGANIGTTVTAQLMALSFNFKLTEVALPVIGVGFAITIFAKKKAIKHAGDALMGFGLMFLGLGILNSGIPYMKENETLRYFFEYYASNPIIGIILGMFATAMVHSSAATVGLVMVLGQAGLIDLQTAICILLGDNIGTTITAQLASLKGNINARRTAWAHTIFNLTGVIIIAIVLPFFVDFVVFVSSKVTPNAGLETQIANSHTLFNSLFAILFLSINKYFVKFLETFIKGKSPTYETGAIYLDKLLLDTPAAAFKASLAELTRGVEITQEMVKTTMQGLLHNDDELLAKVYKEEEIVNQLQKDITKYMVDLGKGTLSDGESIMVPAMINSINNIERTGDHTMDILKLIETKMEKNLYFSDIAVSELKQLSDLIDEMHKKLISLLKFESKDVSDIIRMENEADALYREFSDNHIRRLEQGSCTVESGVVFLDMVSHFERIADRIYKVSLATKDELQGLKR
ncbi:MAG: Na/Pi cotransporter family protein [Gudongella sp.]|nr:Na/Pi cotransporter family protein [Gudongella sp.]